MRPTHRPGTTLLAVTAAAALVLAAVSTRTGTPASAAGVERTAVTTADEPPEQLRNGTFAAGTAGWYSYGTTATDVVDGQLCSVLPGGQVNPWDSGVGQNDVPLINGAAYTLSFEASASPGATVRAAVQLGDPPYTGFLGRDLELTPTLTRYSFDFTATADTDRGQVAFQTGMAAAGVTVCLDNVSLRGGAAVPPYEPDTAPRVRVNQVGYLPLGPKNATVVTDATQPLPWELRDAAGQAVASGQSTPRGVDAASGQNVQTIDFTAHTAPGTGYTLVADGEASFPFDITGTVYDQLRSDALQFFYIQRSGIAIDGDLVGPAYARPAGHLGVPPNQGDTSVPCQPGVCDYSLDVRGGWYDAGDHGKYVVNGGIATAQLLSAFERTKWAPSARPGALGDGTLRVPERGNGIPDVLDEARWELDFLMRMQVPAGQPRAGMAHHKIHDAAWTGLPLAPQDDPQPRYLHPPTTAATINLAATTAQAARLFAPYDAAYAATLLDAARTAWAAAKGNPFIRADDNDGNGGGAYGDADVSDEYYWAAAELYLTTGEAGYLAEVTGSVHHTGAVFTAGGFGWADTAALGRLDLATVPSGLPDRDRVRDSVLAAADGHLATLRAQAYGLPLPAGASSYVWGSNSNILNNIVVLATAYDISRDPAYRDGAVQGMDYILGRNALNHSYVTGWGERASRNQHSRIYGAQVDENLPHPPAGSLAGGPNAALQDPFAANLLAGCAPQFCYVDDIQSYATNEVAINWNSALSWVASFLADQGDGRVPATAPVSVEYLVHGAWPDGFIAQVVITNTGDTPITGWELRFAFLGDQRITQVWSASHTQQGATVVARGLDYNDTIDPGRSVTFGFLGATAGGPNPVPALFMLNGQPAG